jgi:rare lipoprotein A
VVVRVNDRGPLRSDRILDVSYRAAQSLGFSNAGLARVKIEPL